MFITTENEIMSLMPTARWKRPEQLQGYLEEEERVALEPLLGTALYERLLEECERLRGKYGDITPTTIKPTKVAKEDAGLVYADVTDRIERIQKGLPAAPCNPLPDEYVEVPDAEMQTVRLLRICQQIEFYKMLSHKAGLLTVSFNEGGGMNVVGTGDYEPASDKDREEARKDAFMSAGRAVDNLLLFLEADAKGNRYFSELWQQADSFYLHKDLLFQTARVLNEYLDIKGERMTYVALVRDIRFCQNTYLKSRIGGKLLKAVVNFANSFNGFTDTNNDLVYAELIDKLRIALAFYVESRRVEIGPQKDKLARRDSITDAQQAMADACQFIEDNLDALGEAAVGTPIYNAIRTREEQKKREAQNAEAARCRQHKAACEQGRKKLFTSFPATHRTPEYK